MRKLFLTAALTASMSVPLSMAYAASPSGVASPAANAPETAPAAAFRIAFLETELVVLTHDIQNVKQQNANSTDYSRELAGLIPTGG